MTISSIPAGYSIIEQSSKMADSAARDVQDIAQTNLNNRDALAFNKVEFEAPKDTTPSSFVEPMVELNQATQYSRVGTSVIQRDQDMLGSLLDIHI